MVPPAAGAASGGGVRQKDSSFTRFVRRSSPGGRLYRPLFPHLGHALAGPARPPGAADRVARAAARPADDPGHHLAAGPLPVRLVGEQLAAVAYAIARRVDGAELEHLVGDGDVLGP